MDLHSGLPYWIIKNSLYNYHQPLRKNLKIDVAIIGSGITGSLVAHELCEAGIPCAIFDKRTLATGSTAASTAQLQYEIDVPLSEMTEIVGEGIAVNAYHASLQSITDIENVLQSTGVGGDFKRVSSVYLASDRKGRKLLERELEAREKAGLPVEFLDREALLSVHRIKASAALKNGEAAQMDCYQAATGLIRYHQEKHGLPVYSPVEITGYEETKTGYTLKTADDKKISCQYVVIAAGFEAGQFLPKNVMELNSTYALVSKVVDKKQLWPERSLIWETKEPYFYMRTTLDNRMMIGGEDEPFKNPVVRDKLLRKKIRKLERQFKSVYPDIPFEVDMAWCGTFSSTKDGLPYIGTWPGRDRMFYALGYGGNGITFSMIAAQIIKNRLSGQHDDREALFGFDRKRK